MIVLPTKKKINLIFLLVSSENQLHSVFKLFIIIIFTYSSFYPIFLQSLFQGLNSMSSHLSWMFCDTSQNQYWLPSKIFCSFYISFFIISNHHYLINFSINSFQNLLAELICFFLRFTKSGKIEVMLVNLFVDWF